LAITPPRWNTQELEADRTRAIGIFREERLHEPAEQYTRASEAFREKVGAILDSTRNLTDFTDASVLMTLRDADSIDALRYLSGPPISEDDIKVLADVASIAPHRLQENPEILRGIIEIVMSSLDGQRFPWVSEGREPTISERETAIIATSALMAYQRTQTRRRTEGKTHQEQLVFRTLLQAGYTNVQTRHIDVIGDAPGDGEFCSEAVFGNRKADFIVGLMDRRKMPIECKVSNSELNSVKRLNNDAAVKAEVWLEDFGPRHVVPVAILGGVYKLSSLIEAQTRGLTLFWAHDLDKFVQWLDLVRDSQSGTR
jgi:hypothetical protein